jgi:lysophospholipase L1-like esterase
LTPIQPAKTEPIKTKPVKTGPVKIWIFRCLTLLFGFGLVLGAELVLALVPGLGPAPLVVTRAEYEDKLLRSINRFYSQRFFVQHEGKLAAAGKMAERIFVESAPSRPYRVVFLGASSVQGFPQPRRLAAPSFLEAMLADIVPDREVEVFNLGITSIASFAVAQVARDAMRLEPDLVVVYSGHNEFYGIYGEGDSLLESFKGLGYSLRQLHIFRLLNNFSGFFRDTGTERTDLVKLMARRGVVALDSPRRPAAQAHLRRNLREIIRICQRAQVPMVLCTLAANEAGFAPVGSVPITLDQAAAAQWTAWIEAAADQLTGDYVSPEAAAAALADLKQAAALSADHAWLRYLQGRALERLGRGEAASVAFRQARDLDTMPWRAPGGHNEAIRSLAQESGVVLADVEAAFRQAAPPAGVGWELMVDHVHFSVSGQALMARTILNSIEEAARAKGDQAFVIDSLRTVEEYRRSLGDLPVERVLVAKKMGEMLSQVPMDRYNGHNARYLKQLAAMEYQRLSSPEQRGLSAWAKQDGQVPLALAVADRLFEVGDFRRAEAYYDASRLEAPYTQRGDMWATVQWAWAIKRQDKVFTAKQRHVMGAALERASLLADNTAIEPAFIDFAKGHLYHLLGQNQLALAHLERAFAVADFRSKYLLSLFHPLAAELVRAGRIEQARVYAREAGGNKAQIRRLLQVVEAHAADQAVGR